ncbi:MAG: hypothetical protein CMM15_06485 [Rhodospirillaceae bacterium]|nr:hypothetical protein [Rhodospirillaceae bacterium]|tara:strand:+ start:409 stop:1197 length:789 start_codon:yes stop_codon:yes gene_type:complete
MAKSADQQRQKISSLGDPPAASQPASQPAQFCLTVSRTGTQATFKVEKTLEFGASCFISDCSTTTDLSYGDPYNLIDYDSHRGSYALNCYTGVVPSEQTVDTTSDEWKSINLDGNAFVYYNKDGWFVDQWTKQASTIIASSPLVPTPSSFNNELFPLSTTNKSSIGAYSAIPFYAYPTGGEDYNSFYLALTTLEGEPTDPSKTYTPILGIFYGDGNPVSTYNVNNLQVDQKITFSDANPSLTIEITKLENNWPNYAVSYKFL